MVKRFVVIVMCGFVLTNCGGGGDTPSTPAPVTLSGAVTYTYYKAGLTGLEYSNPTEKPIRGAVVELRDSSGAVLKSGNTTETGAYSFTAPPNAALRIFVKAALGTPNAPHVKVVDNTTNDALYTLGVDITTKAVNLNTNFNASSVWGGSSYSGERAAAPFAILDTIYQAEKLIIGADPAVVFPDLTVNWSKNNKPTPGNKSVGDIGTSHYEVTSNLYILGVANLDTDEYDSSVVAHEWSHYFEDKLSRSDSIGGDHATGDILDPRVAFGEGFGNAFSGMVFNDPVYIDTGGPSQATLEIDMNLEADSVPDTKVDGTGTVLVDGFYSESSVQEVLYDLFDSGVSDDDTLGLGFKPIYDVMVGGQKTTPAFTSIFSFLHYLKTANPSLSANIAALAAAENIGSGFGNEDEFEDLDSPIYTLVPVGGTVVNTDVDGFVLQTWDIFGPTAPDDSRNKWLNEMFFKISIPSSGSYTIEVTPTGGGDVAFRLNEKGTCADVDDSSVPGTKETLTKSLSPGMHSMSVMSFGGPVTFTVRIF